MRMNPPTDGSAVAAPTLENLRRLVLLRYTIIVVLLAAIAAGEWWLHMHAALLPVFFCIGMLGAFNVVTQLRLRKPWPLTPVEFLAQLVADIALLGATFYFSGGLANPLVSLLLLPLIVAAIVLRQSHAWGVAALSAGCYGLLVFFHRPIEHRRPPAEVYDSAFHDPGLHAAAVQGAAFDQHLVGMWLTFALSAALVAAFFTRMTQSLRRREAALARAREMALRDERIVALGTLAAGAAHELGTPLGNMLMLADELEARCSADVEARSDVAELKTQIRSCKRILGEMVASAGGARAEAGGPQAADAFFEELLDKWALTRPAVRLDAHWQGERPAPTLVTEQTLVQALINLLNNAADAAAGKPVEVSARCRDGSLEIEIGDRGPGLTLELQERAGAVFVTTKGDGGLGIGLFLANATIERAGGSVQLTARAGGGTLSEVRLPLIEKGVGS
ncbi:MAG TPA: ATP-binding protein [Rhodocyclaceae bacterium]